MNKVMTFKWWCSIINSVFESRYCWSGGNLEFQKLFSEEQTCIMEQLLCEGSLPMACERCGHMLHEHSQPGYKPYSDCNWYECTCSEFVGNFVEIPT